ncbi:MAG TPA: hypothetical protein VGK48_14445 [Terriglobia bacterium]|jgi:hypothetical protein
MILAGPLFAAAQRPVEIEFGVRTGTTFTLPLESQLTGPAALFSTQAFSRPSISVGPVVAVVVQDRISIQFDALYKRIRYNFSSTAGNPVISSSTELSSWEFPLLADYIVLHRSIRPFGGGGMILAESLSGTFLSQTPAYVINGGLELRMSRVVIRPELRYTHWSSVLQEVDVARRENQFEFLVGFLFRGLKR